MVAGLIKDPTLPYAEVTAIPTALLEQSREVLLVWPTQPSNQIKPISENAGANANNKTNKKASRQP